MQTIHLNLLAEQQLAREVEARDPFKPCLAMAICSFCLLVIAGLWVQRQIQEAESQKAALKQRMESVQAESQAGAGADTKTLRGAATEYLGLNQGRPLFAGVLARVKDLIPERIELRQVNLALVQQASEPVAPPAETGGSDRPARKTPRPKPVESLVITLDGRAVGARPEMEVDQFIRTIQADAARQSPWALKEVRLRSIARDDVDRPGAARTGPSAAFVVDCTFQEAR